jgi:hypothetical protein
MRSLILSCLLLITSARYLIAAPAGDVAPQSKRAIAVNFATKLLEPVQVNSLPAPVNPFTLSGSRMAEAEPDQGQAAAAKAAMMASNRSLLIALSERLEPKGTFVVGGEAIILLGQKKLKVGETYPINFEGAVYELEITAIETTRFSVRYKNEEITRPIVITKSAK